MQDDGWNKNLSKTQFLSLFSFNNATIGNISFNNAFLLVIFYNRHNFAADLEKRTNS